METGVIYVATGAGYRALAEASALSLKAVAPELPVDLYTDAPEAAAEGLFDAVHRIGDPHPRSKLDCMAQTRFGRTLYLDCDTLVLAHPGDLFGLLERFEIAMAHEVRRASALIREGLEEETPYAFPQMNSGVVLYRRSDRVLRFLEEWARRFAAADVARDQVILKDMLWQGDLHFYVLPPEFNLRRVTVLDAWEPGDAIPVIVHSHRLKDHLEGRGGRIADVAALIEAEREALAGEWAQAGEDDPIARLRTRKPPAIR